jgi:uncharacterized membrane protein
MLIIFLVPIALLVYFITSINSLNRRVQNLEVKLKGSALPVAASITPASTPTVVPNMGIYTPFFPGATPPNNNPALTQAPAPTFVPPAPSKFALWLKEDPLMKIGALIFILGFGWFISYAFANNWVGPVGRISIGIFAGLVIMVGGYVRMKKYPLQGSFFTALGAGMIMLTIFAGRSIYGFFTPEIAVGFDFIVVAFVSFASYKFNIKSLAFIAQILAFVTPLLAAGKSDSFFLFSYLLFISLATLFLAAVTGWRDLIVSSLVFVGFYSVPFIEGGIFGSQYTREATMILNFAYIFGLLYLISGMSAVVKKGVENFKNEIILAVLNGLFLFIWIYSVAPKDLQVYIFAFWAFLFAVSSFAAFKFSEKMAPFFAYGSVGVAFIGAATAAHLQGAPLTIAFTVEVFLIAMNVLLFTKNTTATASASWLFLVPAMLSLDSISKYSNSTDLFSEHFFVIILMAAVLVVTGRMITTLTGKDQKNKDTSVGSGLVIVGMFYAGYLVWSFIHNFMIGDPDMATFVSLLLFTLVGVSAYFAGLYGNDMARKTYGIILISIVVGRLMLIDVWNMELFGRVITFLGVGILLMSTAFLTKRKKHE